jgi:hypothetical protein
MSRIRSIHPGLFTDEAFMQATPNARLLLIGIWTEAWDDGVFEKKPLTLKAKIFPADNVDVSELLTELEGLGFFQTFKVAGKSYGAVRNFRKFQRPKKPNSSGLLTDELRNYVAITDDGSEPVENQFGTSGEKSPQMEDGGWREGGNTLSKSDPNLCFDQFWKAYPRKIGRGAAERAFQEASNTEASSVIIEKLKTYKFSEDTKFIPSPVNWLKDRRWEDDPQAIDPPKQEKDLRNIPDAQLSNNDYWRKRMQLRNL